MKTKHTQSEIPRRQFLKTSLGAASAIGFPTIIPATALGKGGKAAPSERVRIGMIACGNRGRAAHEYSAMPDVEVVALADPNATQIKRLKSHRNLKGKQFKETADFRTILNDDIDAVHISTADHWHVPALLLAARAGKHAYVEKPLAISAEQCLACQEIIDEHPGLQIQYGTQNRSTPYVRPALELVLNGHIGNIKKTTVWAPRGRQGGSNTPSPTPNGFNMDLWLGPAPKMPYSNDRCNPDSKAGRGIYFIYDYAIGFVAGWGAHPMDQLQWLLDETGVTVPKEIKASGTFPKSGLFDAMTGWDAELLYSNGMNIRFSDEIAVKKYLPKLNNFRPDRHGTLFEGDEGWVYCARGKIQVSSRALLEKRKNPGKKRLIHSKKGHFRNFIDAIQGKTKPVSNLASAMKSDLTCHLVDLAARHGGNVRWDESKNTIVGNNAAKAAMHRPMREPWNVLNPKYTGTKGS